MASPNGKQLLRSSFRLFRQDPRMIWLSVLGTAASLLGFVAMTGIVVVVFFSANLTGGFDVLAVLPGYFVLTAISIFFSVAVVFAASDRIEGSTPTVRGSARKAWGRKSVILRWAFLAFIVGTLVALLERGTGGIAGRVFGFLGALAWGVATFLVLPVLAFEDVGPIQAVEQSARLFEQRFGAVGRTAVRFGVVFLGWILVPVVAIFVGLMLISALPPLGILVVALGVLGLFAVVQAAVTAGIYMRTILYRYATGQSVADLGLDLSETFSLAPR
jgi:Family of unknown function (DUF6159)